MFAVPLVIQVAVGGCDLVEQPLVEWHGAGQRQTNAVSDDPSVSGVAAQLVDGQLGMAKAATRMDPEIVPEAVGDHLDEVHARAQRVQYERDRGIVEQPHHRCSAGHSRRSVSAELDVEDLVEIPFPDHVDRP